MTTPAAATRTASPAAPSPSSESTAARRSPAVRPQQRDQFERALRRHQHEDEPSAQGDKTVLPWGQPPTPTPAAPAPRDLSTLVSSAGAVPRTAAAQDGVSTHLRALGATPGDAPQGHWQVQWAGATTPVQQVDLRRTDSGALHLNITGNVHVNDPARLARLRDRVAARTAAGEVVVLAHPPGTQGYSGTSGDSGNTGRRNRGDDEGSA